MRSTKKVILISDSLISSISKCDIIYLSFGYVIQSVFSDMANNYVAAVVCANVLNFNVNISPTKLNSVKAKKF